MTAILKSLCGVELALFSVLVPAMRFLSSFVDSMSFLFCGTSFISLKIQDQPHGLCINALQSIVNAWSLPNDNPYESQFRHFHWKRTRILRAQKWEATLFSFTFAIAPVGLHLFSMFSEYRGLSGWWRWQMYGDTQKHELQRDNRCGQSPDTKPEEIIAEDN